MSVVTDLRSAHTLSRPRLPRPERLWLIPLFTAVVALGLAVACKAIHPHALPKVALIAVGSLVLFGVCGDALSVALVPAEWRPVRPLLSLPFGAAASGLVLMAFGVAHVPLRVSLWLTLAIGLMAAWRVRRHLPVGREPVPPQRDVDVGSSGGGGQAHGATASSGGGRRSPGLAALGSLPSTWIWSAVLAIVFLVALIPAWRTGALTIYGQNPDSSQVVGIAVLFQHVPPTHTDVRLPLDVVPQEWRFRYPIFYPLAAVSNLVHVDPIKAFPVLAALLVVMVALGWGLVAVRCLGAPAWAGPVIAALIGFTWILQYLAWHPYWNQLWGTALMPYTILFGWQALQRRDGWSAVGALVLLLMLWFAYPLALPYPLVILLGVLVAYWRAPRRPHISSWRGWAATVLLLALLTPAVVGSVLKLKEAIIQLLTPNSALWGGDIKHFISYGRFAGTGGGDVAAGLVLVAAGYGLWRLPGGRRIRACLGAVLAVLLLLDLRFRLSASGTYMDFKHLSFVGLLVLTLAASGLLAAAARPGAWRWPAGVLVVLWAGAALVLDHHDGVSQNEQVTPQLLQIRQWAAALPAGASVRVDIPPTHGGLQLWAVYMLGDHPVDSYEPVLNTTYAHAAAGFRADYSLSLSVYPRADPVGAPAYPQPAFTASPPVFSNAAFVLRRIDWPRRFDNVAQTASTRLVP
jgi:hypothetical protein